MWHTYQTVNMAHLSPCACGTLTKLHLAHLPPCACDTLTKLHLAHLPPCACDTLTKLHLAHLPPCACDTLTKLHLTHLQNCACGTLTTLCMWDTLPTYACGTLTSWRPRRHAYRNPPPPPPPPPSPSLRPFTPSLPHLLLSPRHAAGVQEGSSRRCEPDDRCAQTARLRAH